MSINRIASRYAKSIIDLSIEQNKLDVILADMKSIKKATENRDLHMMLKSPIINSSKKSQVLEAIFGGKIDEMTMAWLKILLNKSRETYLPEIVTEFIEQYKIKMKVSTVTVTTATPLDEAGLESIRKELLASSNTSENVDIITKVDPAILGGFIIEFEDKLYNASVAHKLEQLKKEFTGNAYVKSM